MIKLYVVIAIGAMCTVFYFYGLNVGNSKCRLENFQEQMNTTKNNQIQERRLNETVYKTGLGDIRRILRDKYTITE